jgi:hypothetical protein
MARKVLFALWLTLIVAQTLARSVKAQQSLVLDPQVTYFFGQELTIHALLSEEVAAESIQIFLRTAGETNSISGQVSILSNGLLLYTLDLTTQALRPYAEIEYWFVLTLPGGENLRSEEFSFTYLDNRFEWQSLGDPPFRVFWYEGDLEFGQMVLDKARTGLRNAHALLELTDPTQVDIYVYARGADLQQALQLGQFTMIAGHADPSRNIMLVSLPAGPSQRLEAGRQVPHELMHILLYHKLGDRVGKLPTWLNEGIASLNEEFPNSDYYTVLMDSVARDSLIPMETLCNNFQRDAAVFYLSYAQSESFTRYLYQRYGISSIEALIQSYVNGVGCAIAPEAIMGKDLLGLERDWQSEVLGMNPYGRALQALAPWLIILAAVMVSPLALIFARKRKPA